MKAVVYVRNGSDRSLVYCNVEKPKPCPGEVLVKIHAASLNAADYRSIGLGIVPKRRIYGADIAGVVEACGEGAERLKPGDEVVADIFSSGFGGLAEYVAAPERLLVPKPSCVSFKDAAALPLAGQTALQALRLGGVRAGRKVLVCGAGGGVGTFAVQLARHFGADVTAVCGEGNAELVRGLGATRVIDYSKERFLDGSSRYDLILAVNGGYPLHGYKWALEPGGICVMVGGTYAQVAKFVLFKGLLSLGSKKLRYLAQKTKPEDVKFLLGLAESGKIRPVIDRRYPLCETAEAMRYLGGGHARGKVIVTVSP